MYKKIIFFLKVVSNLWERIAVCFCALFWLTNAAYFEGKRVG